MNYAPYLLSLALALFGCKGSESVRSSALPENVKEDRPIILKEGQAVVLIPEGDKSVMVGASIVDGKLSISEIEPDGKSFSVTWNDSESWESAVMNSSEGKTTTLIDKDGDGLPDLKAIMTKGSLSRFSLNYEP